MRFVKFGMLLTVVAAAVLAVAPGALAAFHGVAMTKGCLSPRNVGQTYTCAVQIQNIVDTAHDTVRVTGLSDTVNASGGAVPTGNILGSVGLVFGGTPGTVSCVGGGGAGTVASPYLGATACTLASGGTIVTSQFSHYTIQAGDFNLDSQPGVPPDPDHRLTDTALVNWNKLC